MHGPAPVLLEAASDAGAWRLVVLALHLGAAGALLVWSVGLVTILAALVITSMGVAGWWADRSRPDDSFSWDGQCWHLNGQPVQVRVALDLGAWMLLRLRWPHGRRPAESVLPLSARRAGASWPHLRAALFVTSRMSSADERGVTP